MKIYLAGPDVFLPDAIEIGRRKVQLCAVHGLSGHYPLDNVVDRTAADVSLQIFKGNEAMMDAANAIIANLTPFRGPGADPGTVYELGYMPAARNSALRIATIRRPMRNAWRVP
jgi:nucleoside 2-deoxyribosyltransferase